MAEHQTCNAIRPDNSHEISRVCAVKPNKGEFYCDIHKCIKAGCHWKKKDQEYPYCWLHWIAPKDIPQENIAQPTSASLSRATTRGSAVSDTEPVPMSHKSHWTFKEKVQLFFKHAKAKV